MKLAWSALALADRDEIFDHISMDSPRAAVAADDLIRHQAERLVDFPESGLPGRVEGRNLRPDDRVRQIRRLTPYGARHHNRPWRRLSDCFIGAWTTRTARFWRW